MNDLDFDNMTIDELTMALDLDKEERDLLESIENDEWVSIANEKAEIKRLQEIAKNQQNGRFTNFLKFIARSRK